MPKQDQPSRWVPEIMYEEASEGLSSHIPFIQVPTEETGIIQQSHITFGQLLCYFLEEELN